MIGLQHYLALGAILFTIGAVGVLTRRNAILILMAVELMLNGVNITLVAFSRFTGTLNGQMFVLFIITVAAAEAAVGLALIITLFRSRDTLNVDEIHVLKW